MSRAEFLFLLLLLGPIIALKLYGYKATLEGNVAKLRGYFTLAGVFALLYFAIVARAVFRADSGLYTLFWFIGVGYALLCIVRPDIPASICAKDTSGNSSTAPGQERNRQTHGSGLIDSRPDVASGVAGTDRGTRRILGGGPSP
jgi:hypothetical protein